MLPNLIERVEGLARMLVLADPADLPALMALQQHAVLLAEDLQGSSADETGALARQIASLADAIVTRKAADVDAVFEEIGTAIEKLQSSTRSPSSALSEIEVQAAVVVESSADSDLVAAWISGCESLLSDLEGRILELERSPSDREAIAEIRRMMHTLKGECGVLSMHDAQRLFHEAESLIDARTEAGAAIPIDPLLTVADWLKAYVSRLAADHGARPTGHEKVMAMLLAVQSSGANGAGAPAETPVPTPAPAPATRAPAVAESPASSAPPAPNKEARDASVRDARPAAGAARESVDTTPLQFAPQPGTEENLADFLCESKEHLTNSEEALLELEQDLGNKELINRVFRAFHTIKGIAGFMALKPIVSLAHSAEQVLDGARSDVLSLGRSELDLILASCDMMMRLLGTLEGAPSPARGDFESLVEKLNAVAEPASSSASAPTRVEAAPARAPAVELPRSAPVATPKPPAVAAPAVDAPAAVASAAAASEEQRSEPTNVATSKVRRDEQTVKVNTARMDGIVTMVGELVIAQQMVVQAAIGANGGGTRMHRTLNHMGKIIRDLQEVSMSLRMVNLKGTFQKMTRLVRDVSQTAGKQIEVVTDGEDVELDRNMVEAITDPLVHMIRNACDHGIEDVEARRATGKRLAGRISLSAYHAGGSIVIEIGDDGRGLHREKLLAKAKAKGILPPDADEASMPDSEVFGLIFLPGFSTAEKVTDLSGRGVGMDVVRKNIEAQRGKVEIRSTPGKGTTFLLKLPLTLAIIDGMVVRVGTQRYVLPTLTIEQSFRPRAEDIKTALGAAEMVQVRGSMLPIYRLNRVLDLREGTERITDALLIVMQADDSRFCLLVDEIVGQSHVVIKSLGAAGRQLKGVSGGAILGDGNVALILDAAQLVALAREDPRAARRAATPDMRERCGARAL